MSKIFFLGGGGFAIELLEYMTTDGITVSGYYSLDEDKELSKYIPWMGFERDKIGELDREAEYIIAIRQLKLRRKLIDFIKSNNLKIGSYVSKSVYFSQFANIGKGLVAFPRAMITGNPVVGDFFFIDANSIISHGDVIGENVVVGPAVTICGDCTIGNNVTFGVNSAVLPGTKIGDNCEISIQSYPNRVIPSDSVVVVKPGKRITNRFNSNF